MTELQDKLDAIRAAIRNPDWDLTAQQEIEAELAELEQRASRFGEAEEYVSFVESQIDRARAIRDERTPPDAEATTDVTNSAAIDSVDAVDWRRVPLCGCASPTCDLKRGELPAACRDRSRGLLDDRTPIARIRHFLQSHRQPYALRVAHHAWGDQYSALLVDARDLHSKALQNRPGRGASVGRRS